MRNTFAILETLLLLVSCSDDGPRTSVTKPTPMDVEGEWETAAIVTMDSCGFNLELTGEAVPMMFHQTGSDVRMEGISGLTGECLNTMYYLDGNTMTYTTEEVFTELGCSLLMKEITTIGFTSTSHFEGSDHIRVSYKSGECGGFQSCEHWLALEGDRCDGCWPGCGRASTSEGSALGMFGISREQLFDAIRKQD